MVASSAASSKWLNGAYWQRAGQGLVKHGDIQGLHKTPYVFWERPMGVCLSEACGLCCCWLNDGVTRDCGA
jgi:hypothetical protein